MTEAQPRWRESPRYFGALEIGAEMESSWRTVTELDTRVVIALRSIDRAVLKRPVAIGDSIRARAKLLAKRPVGEETGLVTLAVGILNQDDELAARMDLTVLWRTEPVASGSESTAEDEDELSPFFEGRLLI